MRALLTLNALLLTFIGIFMIAQPRYRITIEPIISSSPSPSPTPTIEPEQETITGIATWYDAAKNNAWYTRTKGNFESNQRGGPYAFYGAAGPELRKMKNFAYNKKPYQITVTSALTKRTVVVWVVDWCSCKGVKRNPKDDRIIDLAPAVWDALGVGLHRGVMKVQIALFNPRSGR
jgi:hypothetical protein